MPVQLLLECWNCGRSYDPTKSSYCPKCGQHSDDNPDAVDMGDGQSGDFRGYYYTDEDGIRQWTEDYEESIGE